MSLARVCCGRMKVPGAPRAHPAQMGFLARATPDNVPCISRTHVHTSAQTNSCGASMFARCHHHRNGAGELGGGAGRALETGLEVREWALGLGEERWPQARFCQPHMQSQEHSSQLTQSLSPCHTPAVTSPPTTQPHPTATPPAARPQPAPPTMHSTGQKILHICFPAVQEFFQLTQSHPWEAQTRSKSLLCRNSLHLPPPTALQCCLAQGQAAAHQSSWRPGPPPRDCWQSGSESGATECAVHPATTHGDTEAQTEKRTPWACTSQACHTPTYLGPFSCPREPCLLSKASSSWRSDLASCGFPKSSVSPPALPLTTRCWVYAARCQAALKTGPLVAQLHGQLSQVEVVSYPRQAPKSLVPWPATSPV